MSDFYTENERNLFSAENRPVSFSTERLLIIFTTQLCPVSRQLIYVCSETYFNNPRKSKLMRAHLRGREYTVLGYEMIYIIQKKNYRALMFILESILRLIHNSFASFARVLLTNSGGRGGGCMLPHLPLRFFSNVFTCQLSSAAVCLFLRHILVKFGGNRL